MAAIAWTDVQTVPGAPAAKLATVDPVWQAVMVAMANTYLDVNIFGGEDAPVTKLARCLYVLHMYTLEIMGAASALSGTAGPLSKEQAGKLVREYGSIETRGDSLNNDPLSLTSYGRALVTLAWPLTRARVL